MKKWSKCHIIVDGVFIEDLARKYGVHRNSIKTWLKKLKIERCLRKDVETDGMNSAIRQQDVARLHDFATARAKVRG